MSTLARIREFAERRALPEKCDLCAAALPERHAHLIEPAGGKLFCACPGCASLFAHDGGKFRRVPERVERLADFKLSDEEWQGLGIPVGLAFFRKRSPEGAVLAFYPSPLGAVESTVPAGAWDAIVRGNPGLTALESDVEALLVRRTGPRQVAFIVPMDRCYALVGLMRREWRGFSGGDEVWKSVDRFFEELS